MKQVTQKLRVGEINVIEVPVPEAKKGQILVRNIYSCISTGTESSKVRAAQMGYVGKVREKPEQFKMVIDKLRTVGLVQTYRAVMKKLDAHSPLGYSCAGKVIGVGPEVEGFAVGDYAACGGDGACHAEVVAVSSLLAVRLEPQVDLKQAAYNTLGAIAMQGVRQADLRLGEICAVIGLGLLGQLTALLLKAAGIRVVGIDIDPTMVKMAKEHSANLALLRTDAGLEEQIRRFSNGMGCDGVIITAASDSLDPINLAGALARKRGTIVVVGAVPTGFDREPHFYGKELTVKMSCSYGPGRYDPTYEEKGLDYPYGYVRWTENRNMQAFQQLISSKRIDISYLTTHTFKLDDAAKAYEMIVEKSEPFLGVLIEYDCSTAMAPNRVIATRTGRSQKEVREICIGFIGAGSYAQSHLLPNIPRGKDIALRGVVTATPAGARSVADRFGFHFCASRVEEILENDEINTIFIVTRHDTHGEYVTRSLKAGKNVFVEKPLCLRFEELEEIRSAVEAGRASGVQPILMVGYNRRFSPLSGFLKANLRAGPVAMTYRINAGTIPPESWIQDPEIGGGRILGEVCHFVDYLTFINGSLPTSVCAAAMRTPSDMNDTVSIVLRYENGSIGSISYFANGATALPKEYLEVYQDGTTGILDDFRSVRIFAGRKIFNKKLHRQHKGQKHEVELFLDSVRNRTNSPIPFYEIYNTSLVCLKILESIRTAKEVLL
ncbi:MAG: bi-domain-containing oxidoreductase [candidate division WOR-3 bacterium]